MLKHVSEHGEVGDWLTVPTCVYVREFKNKLVGWELVPPPTKERLLLSVL